MFLRRSVAFVLVASCALLAVHPAVASPLSSDELPEALLDACDAEAAAFGSYDKPIAAAVNDLIAMGVFAEPEFAGVRIGFCALRDAGGPAATISCPRDTILLDAAYAGGDRRLALNATLAHEMKHHLQHKTQKAAFGEGYCGSERYSADRAWMEPQADAFGDEVGALFFEGRSVEIENDCSVPVSIYLEAVRPVWTNDAPLSFTLVAPRTTTAVSERSASKFFRYYAETAPRRGPKLVLSGARAADRRIIDGKSYGLTPITLSSESRSSGPFRMILSCPQPDGR